ncbi:MAG: hypothetical protein ABS43_11950 [Bordetella sp. SCN 67-23]|nr:hypothetical protein [Burkholderiales bacterium]ODS73936.1 MAG: hypothetical protein ABS43_11950 [Bordetella sp. SCN 67-23]ODU97407.1 MAG: hypothetical protein ABT00_00800 [Bordetella sp. SCN 68-11]OJW94337.1 MAG: hypothetical protein BGO71_00270 [Burkholderiales bacterium 67-32]
MHRRTVLALLCALSLTACNGYFGSADDDNGGGGGGGGNSDAQGIWTGNLTSDTLSLSMLVTPSNELWAMSWSEGFSQVRRMTRGTGSLNGKAFTGTGKTFGTGDTTVETANLTGTVTSASSFDGNLGQNVTFSSSFSSQYNDAFDLANYAGTWTGRDSISSSPVTFTIQSNGDFSANSQVSGRPDTCSINGRLAKASSGKNYATTTFSFGNATNCLSQHAGASMQGVAMRLTEKDKQPLLLIMATNSSQSAGWFAYARKQ